MRIVWKSILVSPYAGKLPFIDELGGLGRSGFAYAIGASKIFLKFWVP